MVNNHTASWQPAKAGFLKYILRQSAGQEHQLLVIKQRTKSRRTDWKKSASNDLLPTEVAAAAMAKAPLIW